MKNFIDKIYNFFKGEKLLSIKEINSEIQKIDEEIEVINLIIDHLIEIQKNSPKSFSFIQGKIYKNKEKQRLLLERKKKLKLPIYKIKRTK
jgi:hypothetical protein